MGEVGLSLFFIILFGIMNYKGAKSVGNLQLAMVLIMCAAVVVSVIGVIATGHFDASNLQPAYGAEGKSLGSGFVSILALAPFLYVGFDCIPQAAEEYDFPPQKCKMLIISALIVGALIYGAMALVTDCVVPWQQVLTIAATGSEMSNSSVITKEDGWIKRGYRNDYGRPRFAIMNPELTMTLPDYQTACGCTDILMHTMERYFTNGGNMEITDSIAEGLMRTVIENARILINDPKNYDARAEVMWAGSLSHNGLTGCGAVVGGDFASHALEHEIGGLFDVAHGAGLAAIWGSWARYVYKDCLSRFEKFAMNVMRVDPEGTADDVALRGIEAIEDFFRELKMPTSIHELGINPTDEELKLMAHKCSIGCKGSKGSAKVLHEEDMYKIYKAAL